MIPVSPLPWKENFKGQIQRRDNHQPVCDTYIFEDAYYIEHACNAYPRLVGFLKAALNEESFDRFFILQDARRLLKELGEL